MSFLSRLFGPRQTSKSKGPKDVDAELARLEREADNAAPGYVGTAYNKAGDLALRGGRSDHALGYYGRAIDAFLDDAQREAARGVANKIIRVRPSAVRTLCTLTWLDLAAKHQATALLHLRDYVESAKEAGQQVRAATQIYAMAKLSTDREFIDAVADALDGLDFSGRAREVREWAADGAPEAVADDDALAEACLRAAVNSSAGDADLLRDEEPGDEGVPDHGAGAVDEQGPSAESRGDAEAAEVDPPEAVDGVGTGEAAPGHDDLVPGTDASPGTDDASGTDESPGTDDAPGVDAPAPEAGDGISSAPAGGGGRNGKHGGKKSRKSKKKKRYRWD